MWYRTNLYEEGVDNTSKTRRPRHRRNTKNDRVPSASKSSCIKNKVVEVEEHHRNLLLSENKKHMSFECNNVKLAIRVINLKLYVLCVIQISLWCVDSGCSKHMLRNLKLLINFVWKFLGTVHFGNDHVAAILGYDLEVTFRRNTCFVRNLEGVDLLKGNRTTNLYTINLHEMASASPICLMAHATSTKSWLWHQRLSHLNFDTINDLAKNDLITGLPKFKYHKEHLYPSCEQGKSKKASHPPKPVPNSKQWLHLLHMDFFGPMRFESINWKLYILVIVDDYSRYTWVHFLRSKDEAPKEIKIFLKKITALIQALVIICWHLSSSIVEPRNWTLVEVARTMLIFSRAPLFLWAEAIATACYTQNRSIIHRRFNKTPYELINGRKPNISFLHEFGALCYPKNNREDIRKLGAKAMAFEQRSSKLGLQSMTSGKIISGLDLMLRRILRGIAWDNGGKDPGPHKSAPQSAPSFEEKPPGNSYFDELEPQPQPFPSFSSLEVDLGEEKAPNHPSNHILEEKDYEKNEVKGSKSTAKYGNCPMNIQLTSIHMFDAQSMLQKLVSRLAILGVVTPLEDLNVKFLRSLPSEWDTHVVVWMNKPDFDTEGARVETYKQWGLMGRGRGAWGRVVGGIWLWEVGSDGVNTIQRAVPQISVRSQDKKECKESYAKLKKLYDEQREQLGDASIEIQAYTQALKKVEAQLVAHQQSQLWYEEKIRFMKINLDDKTDVLTYHKKLLAEAEKEKEELKAKVDKWHNSSKNLNILLNSQTSAQDKAGLGYGDQMNKGVLSYKNEVLKSVFVSRTSDIEDSHVNDRYADWMHAVPPPMTRIYIPSGPDKEIDDSQFTYGPKQSKPSESDARSSDFNTCKSNCSEETHESMPEPVVNEPKVVSQPKVWSDAPIIEEYESDSEDEHVSLPTKEQETPSFAFINTVKHVKTPRQTVKEQNTCSQSPKPDKKDFSEDCNFHEKMMAKQAEFNNRMSKASGQRKIMPLVLLGEKGKLLLSPQQVVIRDIKDITGTKSLKTMVDQDNPQRALKNKGIVDSGCSRHMTRNKAYLAEYQYFNDDPFCFWRISFLLVSKPQNKTPYELITGKIPIISYIRPFGCHVTILNTIDHLGKFDGKSDEGFLVGYSLQSKAFRVYNLETKRVEENLHITFLENKPNVAGKGPTWLFDLDYLTNSMNYQPVRSENQANKHAGLKEANHSVGTKANIDARNSEIEDESAQDYFVLPIWSFYTSTIKSSKAKNAGKEPNKNLDLKTDEKPIDKEDQVFLDELERLKRQEQDANDAAEALKKEFAKDTEDLLLQAGAAKASSTNTF
ncbi:retrovirus-related pol polyprotein from transposon TNT 1-94 [Tanacetum coccineum]